MGRGPHVVQYSLSSDQLREVQSLAASGSVSRAIPSGSSIPSFVREGLAAKFSGGELIVSASSSMGTLVACIGYREDGALVDQHPVAFFLSSSKSSESLFITGGQIEDANYLSRSLAPHDHLARVAREMLSGAVRPADDMPEVSRNAVNHMIAMFSGSFGS